jgi:AcrR family transcriptional regulator
MGPGLQAGANVSLTPKAVETRERILDAAESVFAQRGFDAATTREIAALSETNVATTYSYFANKEALYAAVLQRAIEPLIDPMERSGDDAAQRQRDGHTNCQSTHDRPAHAPGQQPDDVARTRAQRQTHADFAYAFVDEIREHAKGPHTCEEERQRAKDRRCRRPGHRRAELLAKSRGMVERDRHGSGFQLPDQVLSIGDCGPVVWHDQRKVGSEPLVVGRRHDAHVLRPRIADDPDDALLECVVEEHASDSGFIRPEELCQ